MCATEWAVDNGAVYSIMVRFPGVLVAVKLTAQWDNILLFLCMGCEWET